ncbi:MAG: hypothetical protein AAB420_00160 [Patescibacteria group bacterium]
MTKQEIQIILQKYINDSEFEIEEKKPIINYGGKIIYEEEWELSTEGFADRLFCGGFFNDNILVKKTMTFD